MSAREEGADLAVVVILFEHAALGIHDAIRRHVVVGRGANAVLSHGGDGGGSSLCALHRPGALRSEDGAAVVNLGAARDRAVAVSAEAAPLRGGSHSRETAHYVRLSRYRARTARDEKINEILSCHLARGDLLGHPRDRPRTDPRRSPDHE